MEKVILYALYVHVPSLEDTPFYFVSKEKAEIQKAMYEKEGCTCEVLRIMVNNDHLVPWSTSHKFKE